MFIVSRLSVNKKDKARRELMVNALKMRLNPCTQSAAQRKKKKEEKKAVVVSYSKLDPYQTALMIIMRNTESA